MNELVKEPGLALRSVLLSALMALALAACGGGGSSPGGDGPDNNADNTANPEATRDDDGDNVANASDDCPNTPSGTQVDGRGCPVSPSADDDGDSVSNADDLCPNTPSNTDVDENGCPAGAGDDADGDGVADNGDACPNTPNNESPDIQGCSASQRDDDGDNVIGADDNCPNTAAGEMVDANGCSAAQLADTDNDGVPNEDDDCDGTLAGAPVDAMGCAPMGTRQGETTQVTLVSDEDGEAIAFTLHEPTAVVPGASYPLMLHSHGYGGSRQSARPTGGLLGRFIDNGYYLISIDERGHGQSGGTIRILDPALEGQDLLQILDWASDANNVAQLLRRNDGPTTATQMNNPVVGSVGGSYGGGYQHLIYALDDAHRLDAIAPDITWHDLRYSLFSGNVFKSFWASLLSAFGNRPGNTQDQEVNEGLANGLGGNMLTEAQLALLYENSFASHCAGENNFTAAGGLTPIDSFITQSHLDTLFNFNDAHDNFNCVNALGGDVRLFTKSVGHGIDNGDGGDRCGRLNRNDMTFLWFEEKLKLIADAADDIPKVCLNLGSEGDDGIALDSIPRGGTTVTIDQQTNIVLQEGSQQVTVVPLYEAPASGDIVAGVPTITLEVNDPLLGANGVLDPIVFIGLGIRAVGSNATPTDLMNQIRPFRGYGTFEEELIGVMSRIESGEELVLLIHSAQTQQYFTSGSPGPTPVNIDAVVSLPLIGSNQMAP